MSKIITSPVKRWPGMITIADPLTQAQAHAIEAALDEYEPPLEEKKKKNKNVFFSVRDDMSLPAVQLCVEKWDLENFIHDPFPYSPRGDSHTLIDFVFRELIQVYVGEREIPKE